LISVITTTYKSRERLFRPFKSLMTQTFDLWEWIVWDDSPDDDMHTYRDLMNFAETDARIRVYRAPRHSGIIGEMKQLAGGLARGSWVVELDHDDHIDTRLFEWLCKIHNSYSSVQFVYSDFIELSERDETPFSYGHFYGLGYGSYVRQRIRPTSSSPGYYQYVGQTPAINPITLSHIVGVPNHVRIWKRDLYDRIGRHAHSLPVADDYELILRTFLESPLKTRPSLYSDRPIWMRITYPAYYQYRNEGGNNFTFHRNKLIQILVKNIYNVYYDKIMTKHKEIGWDTSTGYLSKPIWEYPESCYHFPKVEDFFVPEDQDTQHPCISIVLLADDESLSKDNIQSLFSQTYKNWLLFVIGNGCSELDTVMENFDDDRIRYYNLPKDGDISLAWNYAYQMLIRTRYFIIYDRWSPDYLSDQVSRLTKGDVDIDIKRRDVDIDIKREDENEG
ncbi:MAG: glycosyltransferase, partial [Flavobacteriia bacterium]|nr:glycosyltransferase [Flavobacteriia bacterium]